MKNTMKAIFPLMLILLLEGCVKNNENNNKVSKIDANPDCVEFVALWDAGTIADRIGRDKKWVFLNYTIDLWDTPPMESEGNSVGELRASSYARIIEVKGDDYKVESPMNLAHGWINKEHVKTISKKNPKTKALCE